MGVGILSNFGMKGYSGIKVREIFEDVLFDNRDFDSKLVVNETLPNLIKHNNRSVPIYKYIQGLSVGDLPNVVSSEIKDEYNGLLSRSILNNKKRKDYIEKSLEDLISNYSEDPKKVLELIPFLKKDNINIENLGEFLREYLLTILIYLKRKTLLILESYLHLYDWLKFYDKGKES